MCGKKRIATKIPPAGGGGSRKQTFLSFVGAPSEIPIFFQFNARYKSKHKAQPAKK